ncbi:Replication protein a subunit [Thalictrum thalictroides]|uniref:Replication protein A subunit n=1 Tax=Thalictrum thalictroides TaxID=46969 RepID=A0A7J6VDM6_THATH|nr:Replication protein a subunit [Thalictrum thalictroides]
MCTRIIIIVGLNVILEECDIIGDPKVYVQGGGGPASAVAPRDRTSTPGHSSIDHSGIASGNPQSYDGSAVSAPLQSGPLPAHNAVGRTTLHHPKADPGSNTYSNSLSGARHQASASLSGIYGGQSRNLMNTKPKEEGTRDPFNTYGRPMQASHQQQPSMYNRGPIAKNEAPARIIPIAALNPYQGRWTVKARVTSKKDLRHYSNARGEGKVFSFDLLDSDGGEIQVTCFNAVADQFYDIIEAGKVYLISQGTLKPASKNFSRLQNDFEIHLDRNSLVQPSEDDISIPRQQFHFRSIGDIENMESNFILDVIGVVSSIGLTASLTKKDGTETLKRTLQLKDMSGKSVELTLWGNLCNKEGQTLQDMCDSGVFPVLAVKAGRVNDFNGKAVGTLSSSQLFIEPDFEEAQKLREWFVTEGKNTPSVSISKETSGMGRMDVRKTVSQIKDERLGTSDKPDWITVKAAISFIKTENDSFYYTACPLMVGDRQCSKKVANDGDGRWRCERCDQSVEQCDYRYILQFQIQDYTGGIWVTAFQECGEEIFGVSAKDLYLLKQDQNDDKFAEIIRNALFVRYLFKLKVKEEIFSDEQRVRITVVKAEKLDILSESRYLLDMIDKLAEDPNAYFGKAVNSIESGMSSPGLGVKQATSFTNYSGVNTSTSRDLGVAANQAGQYGSSYNSMQGPSVVGSGVSVYCSSCGATGHNSKNCPSITNRQGQPMVSGYVNRASPAGGVAGDGDCYKCHQSGHWARDCPGSNVSSTAVSGNCFKCNQTGHWARDCPGSAAPSVYGSGGSAGRYGGYSNQRTGF